MKSSTNRPILLSEDEKLHDIMMKCARIREASVEKAISENSLSILLTEEISQEDIDKVAGAIEDAYQQLMAVLDYFNALKDFDKSKIPSVLEYLDSMIGALNDAQGELSSASFTTGALSTFMGQKLTLPQIAQSAITIQTKAFDFGKAFSSAVQKIENNLAPLVEDEDLTVPLKDLAGKNGFPDEAKIRSGIEKSMEQSFGGGFFKKIVNFFKKPSGAEKRIMSNLPNIAPKTLASEIADAFMESPLKSFFETEIPDPPDNSEVQGLSDVAQEAQEAEEAAAEDSSSPQQEEESSSSLRDAIAGEKDQPQPPGVAVMDALDTWQSGLSKSAQKTLKAAGRYDSLKSTVQSTMDDLAKTVEDSISSAMSDWRSEHEETLVKSKKFAKKDFESLQNLIPQLASFMLKKVEESTGRITPSKVRRYTYKFLDKRFADRNGILTERYSEKEMLVYRLNKMAGLD